MVCSDGGRSQKTLALRSGVTRNVLIDVELGRRGLLYARLFDLAEVLGVTAAELLADAAGETADRATRL